MPLQDRRASQQVLLHAGSGPQRWHSCCEELESRSLRYQDKRVEVHFHLFFFRDLAERYVLLNFGLVLVVYLVYATYLISAIEIIRGSNYIIEQSLCSVVSSSKVFVTGIISNEVHHHGVWSHLKLFLTPGIAK